MHVRKKTHVNIMRHMNMTWMFQKTHVNIMRHMNMTWMFHVNMHFTDVNIQKMERAFICNMRV